MTFSEETIKLLDYLGTKLGIMIDWSSENVMPYLQDLGARFIQFKIQTSILAIVVLSIIILIGIVVAIVDLWKDWTEGSVFTVSLLAVVVCIGLITYNCYKIIECNTIPEKVIYEYISTQIKK